MEKKLDKEIAQSSFDLLNKLQGDSEPIYVQEQLSAWKNKR